IDEQHHENAEHGHGGLHEAAAQLDQVRNEGFLRLFLVQLVGLGVLGHGVAPVFGWSAGCAGAAGASGACTACGASATGGAGSAGSAAALPETACRASRAVSFRSLRSVFSVSRSDDCTLLAASSISLLNLRSSSISISRWMS